MSSHCLGPTAFGKAPLLPLHPPFVSDFVFSHIILYVTLRNAGRIPGFTQHIFPEESLPHLNLVANIGLCLFLFLVGLEIDAGVIKRHARLSAAVALAGMALPFALGAALSIPIYNTFIDQSVEFAHFMLFTGVAFSITAFPVLCRILTELGLLDTTVGIVVLSAGVGNDIGEVGYLSSRDISLTFFFLVGWTLLALSIALVNAGSGLMALWILLTCIAWTTFLLIPGKTAFLWLAKKTGSSMSLSIPYILFVPAANVCVDRLFSSRKWSNSLLHDSDYNSAIRFSILHRRYRGTRYIWYDPCPRAVRH